MGGSTVLSSLPFSDSSIVYYRSAIAFLDSQVPFLEVVRRPESCFVFQIVMFAFAIYADNSGATRKMGGFFKERLRELGGLDTICDLAAGCLRNIRVFIYYDHD